MDCCMILTLLVLGFNLISCSEFPLRQYHYVDLKMTWTDAQQYCREKYTDLATFESMDDINRLKSNFSYSWAWIGLRDDPKSWNKTITEDANSWRWSSTGDMGKTGYSIWEEAEPNSENANENCVMMGIGGAWADSDCEILKSFICYTATEQNKKLYVYMSNATTWSSAREYCRIHYTDLALIENRLENSEVNSIKPSEDMVWIGLYRVPWTWSDHSKSSFRDWLEFRPNNIGGNQHCIAEDSQHVWDDTGCDSQNIFICQQVSKSKPTLRTTTPRTTMRMTFVTDTDITDPAINTQVLQQLGARLTSQGRTEFRLQWKVEPRKQEKEKLTETVCST